MFKQIPDNHQEGDQSLDSLIQVWMRFVIAFASFLVVLLDPVDSGLPNEYTHMLLITYCLCSACLVFVYDMQSFRELASSRILHWVDATVFLCLIALTGGANSIFFFLLFFPVIVASFSWGYMEGQKVIIATTAVFVMVGLLFVTPGQQYDLGEAILRPVCLIAFGYMIAYWGGARMVLKRRLRLLQEVGTNWNPRFGVNHGIIVNLIRLVEFYHGSRCFVVQERTAQLPKFIMHTSDRHKHNNSEEPKEIAQTTARELLNLPNFLAIAYENPTQRSLKSFNKYIAYDINTLEPTDRYLRESETLSNLLDGESFVSVPYKQRGVASGRLYLVASNIEFTRSDVAFIKQVSDVMSAVIENMQLIESLIEEAEGQERHRISLDVHDTTIQPYIGLTLALDALAMEYTGDTQLTAKIGEIVRMANMSINDLRSYKDTLREKSLMRGDVLISAVKNQGERFLQFYGIHLDVRGVVDPNLSGRLAEAAFQIIKEGLSNILRHTTSKNAFVTFQCAENNLVLEVGNEKEKDAVPVAWFEPKSIFERALSLNGKASVEPDIEGNTVVRVTIPLIKD